MGELANKLSKKYNLKDPLQYENALADLNQHFDTQLTPTLSSNTPIIDFTKKQKTTNKANEAVLIYPTSQSFPHNFHITLYNEFSTHPQVRGLLDARIICSSANLHVTTSISEAVRFEQKEQRLLTNVLEIAWLKFTMQENQSITADNNKIEAERRAEQAALNFLKT